MAANTSSAVYTIGQLLNDMGDVEASRADAARQMAKVTGAPISGSRHSHYMQTAQGYGKRASEVAARIKKQPGVERLRAYCEAAGVIWSRQWVIAERAKLSIGGLELDAIDAMSAEAFMAAIRKLRRADTADTSADKIKKLPRNEQTRRAIQYVNAHRRKVRKATAAYMSLTDLIAEFAGDKGTAEVARIERALRPDRGGCHLEPETSPDK